MTRSVSALVLVAVLALTGCGKSKSNPVSPGDTGSGGSNNSGGGTVTTNNTITATIDGAAFTGGISSASNSGAVFAAAAFSTNLSATLAFGAVSATGTTSIGPSSPTNAILTTPAGAWIANLTGGSGTLTVSSISSTSASGTFSFVMVPAAGNTSSANKVVTNGSFKVTF